MVRHARRVQAALVSEELIRTSILWHEMWHAALEEASRLYFSQDDVQGMLDALTPLHAALERGPQTTSEASFQQAFGAELLEAHGRCQAYVATQSRTELSAAWDIYYHVFRRISKQIAKLAVLELTHVSPKLLEAHDLELAVPGTYQAAAPVVCIRSFARTMMVIPSKQRPRKLTIFGSDGSEHTFLLKGHEDLRQARSPRQASGPPSPGRGRGPSPSPSPGPGPGPLLNPPPPLPPRSPLLTPPLAPSAPPIPVPTTPRQDERAMQLFGLVNTLLSTDRATAKRDLAIQRYSIVPLSPNSGLISWVPRCDTLHALVKEYREQRRTLLNIEHRLMLQMAADYDLLPVLQKLEVFEYALENTGGQDLAKVLWLRSRNAEHWLLRRTNYTRSLAVMSMVGYILGLGDRHPSNLMLHRYSGKILHIDFGDCFEVALHRDKFPERVPFRLTRMLVNAMEVSGIEGNFRSTCESTMGVLRHNRHSVMAMLEAFVYDPLINWRLLVAPELEEARAPVAPHLGTAPWHRPLAPPPELEDSTAFLHPHPPFLTAHPKT